MKNLLALVFLVSMVSACAGNHVKEAPTTATNTPPVTSAPQNVTPAATSSTTESNILGNPLTDPNNILSKRSVYFDFDQYGVKDEYRALVEAHAKYLVNHPELSARVEGNADNRGSREYNLALGQKRAVAVKKLMSLFGVQDKQIETISYGKEKPRATGEDEASWAKNRRDDIVYPGE